MTKATRIAGFSGPYYFLSNLYDSTIEVGERSYPTVEHFYQAMKARDKAAHKWIRLASTPQEARKRGQTIHLVSWWEQIKETVMLLGLQLKFQSKGLRRKLINTHPATLIERNTWGDQYWGTDTRGKGLNRLGQLLMQVREQFTLDGKPYLAHHYEPITLWKVTG